MERMPIQPENEGPKVDLNTWEGIELMWLYESPDGQATVDTHPVGEEYEMKIKVGSEERGINLGKVDVEMAKAMHQQAVDFLESRKADIKLAAKSTADTLARQIETRLAGAAGK